jgi:hypothetical protein
MAGYWHRRCTRCDSVDLGLRRVQQEEGLIDATGPGRRKRPPSSSAPLPPLRG